MSSLAVSSMGTFSVRKLRADIQNVTMRRNRIVPNLTRFLAFYLFVCLAFYFYFRYYLSDESEHGTPRPAALTHENAYRPLKELSSKQVAGTAKELFQRLTGKFWRHSRPHIGKASASYGSADDVLARLEDSLKKQSNLQSPNAVIAGANLKTSFNFTDKSEVKTQNKDEGSRSFITENHVSKKTNGSKTTKLGETIILDNAGLVERTPNGEVPEISSMARRLQEFRTEWLRQRRARVDWQSMLRPCVDNMAWGLAKKYWGKANRSSAITSDVILVDIRPAGEFSKIFIHSKTADNRTKTIGGDTWRVYLRGTASIAANVFDHNNGTYEALFLVSEPGVYQLEIYLDYSLCDGFRDPPRDWFIVGNAQGKYQKEGILGTLDDYLFQPLKQGDTVTVTIPAPQLTMSLEDKLTGLNACSTTCKHLWDGFGQWVKGEWRPYLKEFYNWTMPLNYQPSGSLWIYGDSIAVQHLNSVKNRPLCRKLYTQCKRSYNWIYPVKSEMLSKEEDDDLDFRPEKVIETIFNVLRNPLMQRKDSTLLLNLGIHFPIGVNFTTYQKLIDDVIYFLKETEENAKGEGVPKYKAKVIWKTLTAINKEKSKQLNITNWRFFTTQRVALFNTYATSAMCKAGFDVIDVFPLTDSYPHGTQDVVHYIPSVFSMMEEMLEKYKVQNDSDIGRNTVIDRIKQCIS